MAETVKNIFDNRDVEFITDQIPLMKSKMFNRILEFYIPYVRKLINFVNKPLFKLFKRFGTRIGQFMGPVLILISQTVNFFLESNYNSLIGIIFL